MSSPSVARVASRHIEARRVQDERAITNWLYDQLDHRTEKLINQAKHDLWSGPHQESGYPGFERATREIRRSLDRIRTDLWYDNQSGMVSEHEPQPWEDEEGLVVEPDWHDYVHYDWSDVLRTALGELAEYVK